MTYLEQILNLHRAGVVKQGDISLIQVLHDDWCSMLTGGAECNCNPEVRVMQSEKPQ